MHGLWRDGVHSGMGRRGAGRIREEHGLQSLGLGGTIDYVYLKCEVNKTRSVSPIILSSH